MKSIWHSPLFRHWRAGWRLLSIIGGISVAASLPIYLLGIAIWYASPERIQHAVTEGAYCLYFLTFFPYIFHRLLNRLGFGVLEILSPAAWKPGPSAKTPSVYVDGVNS